MSPSLSTFKAANAATKLSFSPVAVFVGGTSGLGQGAAEAFARYTGDNAHIILVGRNEEAAKKIIDGLSKNETARYDFLQCDASKLSNVVTALKDLREKHKVKKINYLFMSPGFMTTKGEFDDNGEGIDKKLALHFYSRFKFFAELAPLLQVAKDAGEEARVVSVLGSGNGGKLDTEDLGLKNSYSLRRGSSQGCTYNDLMVEELATRYPFSFTHINPGAVKTNLLARSNSWSLSILDTLVSPISSSLVDASERMVRVLYDPAFATGAHHLNSNVGPVSQGSLHVNETDQKTLYQHFIDVSSQF